MSKNAISPISFKRIFPLLISFSPNSYRVISTDAENWMKPVFSTSTTIVDQNLIGQPADPNRPFREFRCNRPNANHVGFLRQNVKLLNEPLCDVHSADTASEQHQWWPHRTTKGIEKKPEHTLDTTVRNDYQWRCSYPIGNTRHSANPNKHPVRGSGTYLMIYFETYLGHFSPFYTCKFTQYLTQISCVVNQWIIAILLLLFIAVPVNFLRDLSGQQRLLKEGISYEHQYDARGNPSYPPRGRVRFTSEVSPQFCC